LRFTGLLLAGGLRPAERPVHDPRLALDDAADAVHARLAGRLQHHGHAIRIAGRAGDDQADAHVERAVHVLVGHVADALQVAEDRVGRPG